MNRAALRNVVSSHGQVVREGAEMGVVQKGLIPGNTLVQLNTASPDRPVARSQ